MITVPELAADALGEFLANYMRRRFGSSQAHLVEMVPSIARIALEYFAIRTAEIGAARTGDSSCMAPIFARALSGRRFRAQRAQL
jgi:hypothetical protein